MAQNRVIIGDRRDAIKDARLEITNPTSGDEGGVMLPYVGLVATDKPDPLNQGGSTCAHLKGMLVYNTATAGSGATAVSPGLYYNDGSRWILLKDIDTQQLAQNFWSTKGNAGTVAGTNFLGTTDDQDLVLKRENKQVGRLTADNVYFGNNAGTSNAGQNNVAIGKNALPLNSNNFNVAIGFNSLSKSSTGSGNVAIGSGTLANSSTGKNNVALGVYALNKLASGEDNIAIGTNALSNVTGNNHNISIGANSSVANTGTFNTVIGSKALKKSTKGSSNVVIGYLSASGGETANPIADFGTNNTAVGTQSMQSGSGNNNTMLGAA